MIHDTSRNGYQPSQESQSSNVNARTPNVGAASPTPPAKLSTPRLTKRTKPLSSLDIASTLLRKLSSSPEVIDVAPSENEGESTSSSASSESLSKLRRERNDWENPITLPRCLFNRLLRCPTDMLSRDISCIEVSPAKAAKRVLKLIAMSSTDKIARCRADV